MTMHKNKFPILEYDDNPKAVIMPGHEELNFKLPKKCVYAFLGEYIDKYALENKAKGVARFESITKHYPIYVLYYKGDQL